MLSMFQIKNCSEYLNKSNPKQDFKIRFFHFTPNKICILFFYRPAICAYAMPIYMGHLISLECKRFDEKKTIIIYKAL